MRYVQNSDREIGDCYLDEKELSLHEEKKTCKDCGKPIFKFEGWMHELELGVQAAAAYPNVVYTVTPHNAQPAA